MKIRDRDGLEEALSDALANQMDTHEYVDRSEYPGRERELLLGFTTWGREDDPFSGADYHNVSNTHPGAMADLFATVSEHTDPFVVWMTDVGGWPRAAQLEGDDRSIFRLEARDDDVTAEKLILGIVDSEPAGFGGEPE